MLTNKKLGTLLLVVETIYGVYALYRLWFPSPERDLWLWLLAFVPVFIALRWMLYRQISIPRHLTILSLLFIVLSIANISFAPYRRTPDLFYSWFILMCRPIIGLYLFTLFTNTSYWLRKLNAILLATLLLAGLVTFLSLTSTQWNSKSDSLLFVIDYLPRFTIFPGAEGGFNANELAGALTFFVPLAAGLMFWNTPSRTFSARVIRWGYGVVFMLSFLALFLGQSRFGLIGVLVALAGMVPLLIRSRRGRWGAWAALFAIAILEVMIARSVFAPTRVTQQTERDEDSVSARFDIWKSAIDIIHDYPLTGVGLNMFRDNRVRALYPVPSFIQPVLPHTHNEFLQFGTDMGVPGLLLFIGWYTALAYLLWQTYRKGDPAAKVVAAAVGGGLLAHALFGAGDAIPIWDRFGFLMFILIGLASAQYTLTFKPPPASDSQNDSPRPAAS